MDNVFKKMCITVKVIETLNQMTGILIERISNVYWMLYRAESRLIKRQNSTLDVKILRYYL